MAGVVLRIEVDDRIAVLTLNRPEVRNALSIELLRALFRAVADLEADDGVDALILTGADPAFSAGVDLTDFAPVLRGVAETAAGSSSKRGPFPARTKLLIGAVNGAAVTGGLELALNCDFLVASERARFADTHARVGVMPGWGMSVLLPERVGVTRAREMSVTGNFVDPHTALTWGLVNHVVPHEELLAFCRGLATDSLSIDQRAVRQLLASYERISLTDGEEAWAIEGEVSRAWEGDGYDASAIAARRAGIAERGRKQSKDAAGG